MSKQYTHFGYQEVEIEKKEDYVKNVFDSVANKYDIMNDAMSFGIHRLWKNAFIEQLAPKPYMKLLDIGGGTGDIAFRFLKKGGGHVIVSDINENMLEVGKQRAIDRNILQNIEWQQANAEELPFADNSFDAVTIAFCIRNITRIEVALAEIYRVLKPGGKFLCLEFSQVNDVIVKKIYDAWSFHAIPFMGQLITKDRDSYQYLAESIRKFPNQEHFLAMIKEAGFVKASYRNYSKGIVASHMGWKI